MREGGGTRGEAPRDQRRLFIRHLVLNKALLRDLQTHAALDHLFVALTPEMWTELFADAVERELPKVLELVNRVQNHLTAGVVSNNQHFIDEVLGNTINGTIYAGIRARTTAAPQQMWFGPSGDPRSGGIHTPEAIKLVWSSHREIMYDYGPVPASAPLRQS